MECVTVGYGLCYCRIWTVLLQDMDSVTVGYGLCYCRIWTTLNKADIFEGRLLLRLCSLHLWFVVYTGLLKMIVGVLTTCHTQYT
jgi:hypothetical protein